MIQTFNFKNQNYHMRLLDFKEDLTSFIAFLSKNQDHFLDYQVHQPTAEDAREFFEDYPPNIPIEQKHLLGVFHKQELVGMIDLLNGFPRADISMIGYLVLLPNYRGQGLAQALYDLIEVYSRRVGDSSLRLGVIKDNIPAVNFWQKQGFQELSSYPTEYGEQMTMEKRLA